VRQTGRSPSTTPHVGSQLLQSGRGEGLAGQLVEADSAMAPNNVSSARPATRQPFASPALQQLAAYVRGGGG